MASISHSRTDIIQKSQVKSKSKGLIEEIEDCYLASADVEPSHIEQISHLKNLGQSVPW